VAPKGLKVKGVGWTPKRGCEPPGARMIKESLSGKTRDSDAEAGRRSPAGVAIVLERSSCESCGQDKKSLSDTPDVCYTLTSLSLYVSLPASIQRPTGHRQRRTSPRSSCQYVRFNGFEGIDTWLP